MGAFIDKAAHRSTALLLWLVSLRLTAQGLEVTLLEAFLLLAPPTIAVLAYSTLPDSVDRGGYGHRGFGHSLAGLISLTTPAYLVVDYAGALLGLEALRAAAPLTYLAALLGHGSHIALDSLTHEGVPLLWPVGEKLSAAHFDAGGPLFAAIALLSTLTSFLVFLDLLGLYTSGGAFRLDA